MPPELYCADLSLNAGEPLYGTAAEAEHWLVLEHDAAWGPKGVEDSQLPHEVLAHLKALSSRIPSLRLQLARKPDRAPEGVRAFFATVRQDAQALWEVRAESLTALTELDLPALVRGEDAAWATRLHEPYFFVCVHGKRDRCCAQRGMPLYTELSRLAPERSFVTTHLGGHRFAATMVVLPHGICYGRVPEGAGPGIIEAHDRGSMFDLDHVRGRSSYESEAQAAEVSIRRELGELALDALIFVKSEPVEGGKRVTFAHASTGQTHSRVIHEEAMPPLSQSCGAPAKPSSRLVVLDQS
jgi:hypothetical protein